MSSCGKQGDGSLVFARGGGSPCSSLQEGAKESTPNSPGRRGKTVNSEACGRMAVEAFGQATKVCLCKRCLFLRLLIDFERERSIDQLPPAHPPTGDLSYNSGMRFNQDSNLQSFSAQDDA